MAPTSLRGSVPVGNPGYWGEMTSSTDWCEMNYVVSFYIAEYWNALSSLAMSLVGAAGLYLHRDSALELRFQAAFACVALIGIGSTAFHTSMTRVGQLGDQLPMLYAGFSTLYIVLEHATPVAKSPSSSVGNTGGSAGNGILAATARPRTWLPFVLAAWSVCVTLLVTCFEGLAQLVMFHVSFAASEFFSLWRMYCIYVARKADAAAAKTVFGGNLGKMAPHCFDEATGLPRIVVATMDYVRKNGLGVEGIFRKSAGEVAVREAKATINGGGAVNFEAQGDVHLAAVLLKRFFRELQEPAVGFEFYDAVLANTTKDPAIKCAELAALFDAALPERNLVLLWHVFSFLCEVSAQSELNKMTNANLAVVFGPNLLRSNTTGGGGFADVGKVNQFTRFLLENRRFETVFGSSKGRRVRESAHRSAGTSS